MRRDPISGLWLPENRGLRPSMRASPPRIMYAGAPSEASVPVVSGGGGGGGGAPSPSGSIRFDTRAGGTHDIQTSSTMAAALSASGFSNVHAGQRSLPYHVDWTNDADGAGTRAFRFNWQGSSGPGDEHDMMIFRGMSSLGITSDELYIQWRIWQGRTSSGGGVGSVGSWDAYGGPGSGKRIVWQTSAGGDGRFTFAPGTEADKLGQFFVANSYNPTTAGVAPVDWQTYAHQWVFLTFRLKPESSNGEGDGIIEAWVDDTKFYSNLAAVTRQYAYTGQLEIGGPTWIEPPQDQTMYVADIVVWQP